MKQVSVVLENRGSGAVTAELPELKKTTSHIQLVSFVVDHIGQRMLYMGQNFMETLA